MRLRSSQVYPLYLQCLSLWAIRFTTWAALIKPHGQELVRGQFHSGPVLGYWSVRKIQLALTKSGISRFVLRNWIPLFQQSFLNLLVLMMMVAVDIMVVMMMVVDFMVVQLLVMILG